MTDVVPLRSVCDILNGYAFKSSDYSDVGFRVMRIGNVQKGKIVESDPMFIPSTIAAALPTFQLRKDDILVSLTGNVGRVGQVPPELLPAVLNQRVTVIRPNNPTISHGYLYQYLNSDVFESNAIRNANGVAQLNLSTKWIAEHEIPLPPLEDQKRIAYLLSKVEGLITQRQQHLQQLDDLLKNVFLTMFGDPTTNEHHWDVEELKHLTSEKIGYGIVQPGQPVEDGVPVIRVGDFVGTQIHSSNITMVAKEVSAKHKGSVLKGDEILVACVGATIGKVAIVEPRHKGHNIVRATARIRASDRVEQLFLAHYLLSEFAQRYYSNVTRAVGQPTLNIKQIEELPVVVPPMVLQTAFAKHAEAIEILRTSLHESLNSLEHLFGILSQQSFSGELDLSRVVVPETAAAKNEADTIEPMEVITDEAAFELPVPLDVNKLDNTKGRKTVMEQWLTAYAQQLGKQSFSTDEFMKLVGQTLSDLQSADDAPDIDYELSAADYEHVQAWIFENMESQRIKRNYDNSNNRVQIFTAKD